MEKDLPPWKIFTKAISLIWEKRLFALYISFPVILIYTLVGVAIDLEMIKLVSPELSSEQDLERIAKGELPLSHDDFGAGLAFFLLFWFLHTGMAVFWHRSILLGEHPVRQLPIRFDWAVWRYILYVLGILLWGLLLFLTMTAFFVLLGFLSGTSGGVLTFLLFGLPLILLFGIIMFRLSLVLPAAAIDMRDFGFRRVWRASRGHSFQILAIIFLMLALGIAIAILMASTLAVIGTPAFAFYAGLPRSLTLTLEGIVYAAQTLISIGVLSLSFAYLTYEGPRGGAVTRK